MPVIGNNTDPTRSEGHLCLPKHFSFNVKEAIQSIVTGNFRWFFRKRLRITLIGDKKKINQSPVELNDQQLQYPEYRYLDLLSDQETKSEGNPFSEENDGVKEDGSRILPILALNEVFIGESLSSRVSYLELQVDQQQPFKTRNSGLCIATGTGSTSWIFNVNKMVKAPVTTTKVPVTTSKAPATTTKAPVTTTKAPVTTSKAPATTTTEKVETTTKRTYDCSQGSGKHPSPYDCAEFYVCFGGVAHIFHCPGNLWYDPKLKVCNWPSEVDCHISF